jgi:hypothetical protein
MRSLVPKEVFSEPSAVTYPNSELSNCPWATGSEVRGGHRTVGTVSWSFDDAKFSKLMLGSFISSVAVTLSLTNMHHTSVLPGGLEPSCPLSVHRVIVRQAGAHPRLSCCLLAGASTRLCFLSQCNGQLFMRSPSEVLLLRWHSVHCPYG